MLFFTFHAFLIISVHKILNFMHFSQKHYRRTDGRTDGRTDTRSFSRFIATKKTVSKPLSANSFKYDIEENCFSGFWRCFLGQIPVIWWVTPTSFSLKRFFSLFVTLLVEKYGPFRWKNEDLTLKYVFRCAILFQTCFQGPMPIFWQVTTIF